MMTRIRNMVRNVTAWLNTPTKPNKRWAALLSLTLGGISGFTRARRLDRIEARLAALEAKPEPVKADVPAEPEVPRRVSMLACPHGVPNFGPECPVCDGAANR